MSDLMGPTTKRQKVGENDDVKPPELCQATIRVQLARQGQAKPLYECSSCYRRRGADYGWQIWWDELGMKHWACARCMLVWPLAETEGAKGKGRWYKVPPANTSEPPAVTGD